MLLAFATGGVLVYTTCAGIAAWVYLCHRCTRAETLAF